MFELRDDIHYVQAQSQQVVAIIESLNKPMVAVAGRPSEPTQAHIVGIRNRSGLFSVFVFLHMQDSQEAVIFLHSPEEVSMEEYHETELEALGFVESMGFIVDNLNFRNQSPERQAELMETLPVFQPDLKSLPASRTSGHDEGEILPVTDGGPAEPDVLDLEEVIEEKGRVAARPTSVSKEGLAKVMRLLSSF